jgi:hypothetical protein
MTRWDEMCAQIAKRFNVAEAGIADVLAFGNTGECATTIPGQRLLK